MSKTSSKNIIVHIGGNRNTINMYAPKEKEPSFLKKFLHLLGEKLLSVFRWV